MYQKYAQLVLKTGIQLREGQCLMIRAEPVHWDLACEIEAEAYRMGAKLVEFEMTHLKSTVNRSLYQKERFLEYVPEFLSQKVKEQIAEQWSMIRLDGMEDPELSKKIDQKRNAMTYKAQRMVSKPLLTAMLNGTCSWCIAPAATEGWAKQMGLRDRDELWQLLISILKLDQKDPNLAWQKQCEVLQQRTRILNDLQVEYLHFTGPETDLKIWINPYAEWEGGGMPGSGGSVIMANLPTEEVFTVPDYKKTQGRVKVTRPVNVLGDQVRDAWFVFENGQVVDFGASYGKHLLEELFRIDPKARFLGEVALVDARSPIFQCGKVFNSILLDENAACHIALGSGISSSMKEFRTKSEDELDQQGCNKSLLHTDFMIGSEAVSVVAQARDGRTIPIIKSGLFVI